jgi:hypothetical protein
MSDLNRYSKTLADVYAVVKLFEVEGIKIFPVGYNSTQSPKEYIRFNPVLSEKAILSNLTGILYFDIYTTSGEGPTRAYIIADKLEKHFRGKSFASIDNVTVTQFSLESNLVVKGEAKNTAYLHTTYQIQFNNFRKEI